VLVFWDATIFCNNFARCWVFWDIVEKGGLVAYGCTAQHAVGVFESFGNIWPPNEDFGRMNKR
jgi:hypothetical protein